MGKKGHHARYLGKKEKIVSKKMALFITHLLIRSLLGVFTSITSTHSRKFPLNYASIPTPKCLPISAIFLCTLRPIRKKSQWAFSFLVQWYHSAPVLTAEPADELLPSWSQVRSVKKVQTPILVILSPSCAPVVTSESLASGTFPSEAETP